jgi:hypothetical protein
MAKVHNHTPPPFLGTIVQELIVDGLPPCAISEADGTYSITAQLTDEDAVALTVAAPSHDELCQHAQHALGLSGIGSRIERERDAIGLYAAPLRLPSGESTLMLEGREVLWAVAHASSVAIRALISAAQAAMGIHDRQ